MCLASVIRSERPAPKGQESLAQGLPWVGRYKRFALKGLELPTRSGSMVWNRFSPYPVAPSGLIRVGQLPRVNPGLYFLGHFGPRIGNVHISHCMQLYADHSLPNYLIQNA
jgi:hypothetical protein